MDSTERGQSSLETTKSDTGISSKVGIDLSTGIDEENHGLGVANFYLSIPVIFLIFVLADFLRGSTNFLSAKKYFSSLK